MTIEKSLVQVSLCLCRCCCRLYVQSLVTLCLWEGCMSPPAFYTLCEWLCLCCVCFRTTAWADLSSTWALTLNQSCSGSWKTSSRDIRWVCWLMPVSKTQVKTSGDFLSFNKLLLLLFCPCCRAQWLKTRPPAPTSLFLFPPVWRKVRFHVLCRGLLCLSLCADDDVCFWLVQRSGCVLWWREINKCCSTGDISPTGWCFICFLLLLWRFNSSVLASMYWTFFLQAQTCTLSQGLTFDLFPIPHWIVTTPGSRPVRLKQLWRILRVQRSPGRYLSTCYTLLSLFLLNYYYCCHSFLIL